jgi:hypothetical protein
MNFTIIGLREQIKKILIEKCIIVPCHFTFPASEYPRKNSADFLVYYPSWEADSHFAGQEKFHVLWNCTAKYRVYKSLSIIIDLNIFPATSRSFELLRPKLNVSHFPLSIWSPQCLQKSTNSDALYRLTFSILLSLSLGPNVDNYRS